MNSTLDILKLIVACIWISLFNVANANQLKGQSMEFVMDETMLISCQTLGHSLYMECVKKIPILPKEIAACVGLKATYLLCVSQLNAPYPVMPSIDPDPYSSNPFTPCDSETAHLILYDICPTIP